MPAHVLRLSRDRLAPAARTALPPANRVLYLLEGALAVDGRALAVGSAWHGAGACATVAGPGGATVLRYELVKKDARTPGRPLLAHDVSLDANGAYLMRCDRVEFELGAEARPHRHRGGGIRYLVHGTLELRIEGERDRVIKAGEAWFESGREPVVARASATEETSFVRCAILPAEIRGQSSIVYVDPAEGARMRPRTYTMYVDEPFTLGKP